MSDLSEFIKNKKAQCPEFAKNYDKGFRLFRRKALLQQRIIDSPYKTKSNSFIMHIALKNC